ncbi:MAG: hypothetical protein CVV10_04885 [Gammaproteobacteria bacterium HGW-Gammaproteobacteria-14]|nr:MAG: hypothetical protein CVV10_04885 [Gammaproteobacteria bacterium HGW-Gammaproteobacteria-14]
MLAALTNPLWAETTDSLANRLAQTEARLASLEQQNSVEQRIQINGFLRFAMEQSNDIKDAAGNDLLYRGTVDDDSWNNRRLTRAGLQVNARISDDAEAVVQLLSRASEDFNVEAQWAYLAYDVAPSVKLRAGRLVLPFYLHSQYLNVGYAYPWIELPTEIYGAIPVDTMEGLDATWTVNTGPVSHSINVFWGSMQVDIGNGLLFDINNQHGLNIRSSMGNISTWAGFTSSQVNLDLSSIFAAIPDPTSYNLDKAYAHYASVGIQYDNGSLLMMAETTELKINAPDNWFPTQPASYVMAGYRFGKVMPHLTWAMVDARGVGKVDDSLPFGIAQSLFDDYADRQKSWTLGARYDVTSGIALKAEATRFYDFDNDRVNTSGTFNGGGAPDKANPMVFRLAVDAVF